MLIQCGSLLVMPICSPSVSLPFNVWKGVLFPTVLCNHALFHWLSGPGHADFFLHVASDSPSWEMRLDSTG